jgi:DNA-binding PadR family transcriptional regulator
MRTAGPQIDPTPVRTTTGEALLGILSLRAMTGYEIRQTVQRSINNFWSESFGQIYPALKRLEAEGAITSVEKPAGSGTRQGRIYSLTPAGEARLHLWLGEPVHTRIARNELLLKLFFGPHADPVALRQHVVAAHKRARRDLLRYRALVRDLNAKHAGNPGLPYWLITVRFGIAEAKAIRRWAERTLDTLQALESGATSTQAAPAPSTPAPSAPSVSK